MILKALASRGPRGLLVATSIPVYRAHCETCHESISCSTEPGLLILLDHHTQHTHPDALPAPRV